MAKKSFKDSTAHLDRFFSNPNEKQEKPRAYEETETHPQESALPALPEQPKPKYYRINLKLKAEYRDYLDQVSWESRKSITQYINDLIQADMDTRNTSGI